MAHRIKRKQKELTRPASVSAPARRTSGAVSSRKKRQPFDSMLFILLVVMLLFGLIMVFSASSINSFYSSEDHNSYIYLISQARWVILGFIAMIILSNMDYHKIAKMSPMLMLITIGLLVIVLFMPEIKGARRWIGTENVSFQPSEFAKIVLILFLSYRMSQDSEEKFKTFKGLLPYLGVVFAFALLVLAEKHLSGTAVVLVVGLLLLLAGGAKMIHFGLLALVGGVVSVAAVLLEPYRLQRVLTFMDPFADKMGDGWQIVQSLYAIGSGGLFGVGLGRSRQKYLYIPEPQNDFIFSIICEELGWIGATLVLALFALLIWRTVKIALNAPDKLGSLLSFGFACLIAVQVIVNVAVVTSSMPVTGMQLPFFSAGGSSLLFLLGGMGVLLNISRQCKK